MWLTDSRPWLNNNIKQIFMKYYIEKGSSQHCNVVTLHTLCAYLTNYQNELENRRENMEKEWSVKWENAIAKWISKYNYKKK